MPSFPSYYLNNLERKRQRSRELREGLNEGMAGVLGGVDRLAQMQAALEEKGLRAEALQHGREIEAQNQARADQRFAWEGEDRERKNAQADQKFWLELRKSATQGNAALGGERESPAEDEAEQGEEPGDVLARMQGYLGGQEGGEIAPEDVEGQATSPEASDILARLKASMEPGAIPMEPGPPSAADKMDAARLRKMEADAAIAERKAKGGGSAPKPKVIPAPTAKAPPVKDDAPDTRTRSRSRAIGAANQILDEIEKSAKKFEEATGGPAVGRITGRLRQVATGYVPGLNEAERTAFLGNAEALNAMLFPILGREDAPTDPEVKRLEPLMISGKETPEELASKITTIRRLIQIQTSMLPTTPTAQAAPPAVPADPQAAFMQVATDLAKQLGRKPTKEELQEAMRAAGVLE